MGTTFIIDDDNNDFAKKVNSELGIQSLSYYELRTDSEFENFVSNLFTKHVIDKLIIPVALGESPNNQIGIKIGLYIRLTLDINKKNLIPLIFISEKSLETLLLSGQNHAAIIAVTEGSVLCKENVSDVKAHVAAGKPISEQDFSNEILKNIIIEKPETLGPHSLANEWGVYQLDRVAKLNSLPSDSPAFKRKSTLYFKYLTSLNHSIATTSGHLSAIGNTAASPLVIDANSKRILYIDDEGSKGWTSVLKVIFKNGVFVSVTGDNKSTDEFFTEIKKRIEEDWDLILLDLRLLPDKEDVAGLILPIENYSGTKLLKQIKALNQGTQVIIFTASNKAWNMKQLMDLGADGYYIKESPTYLIPDALSFKNYQNFLEAVNYCFEKKYLRTIFTEQQDAISKKTHYNNDFLTLSEIGLKSSFKLLNLGMRESAYLNYFQVIESYIEITFDTVNKSILDLSGAEKKTKTGNKYHITWHSGTTTEVPYCEKKDTTDYVRFTTTLPKLSFIMAFKFNWDDNGLKKIAELVDKRNSIAHKGLADTLALSDFYELIDIVKIFRKEN